MKFLVIILHKNYAAIKKIYIAITAFIIFSENISSIHITPLVPLLNSSEMNRHMVYMICLRAGSA
jgi:hypothetical protein